VNTEVATRAREQEFCDIYIRNSKDLVDGLKSTALAFRTATYLA